MRLKSMLSALAITLAWPAGGPGFAQDKQAAEAPAPVQADPQLKEMARGLITTALRASHAEDIFADLRRTLKDVYIPTMRDAIQGTLPGVPAPDAKSAAAMAKLLTVMDYMRKAGDDLSAALSENRDAMISDAAEQIAKSAKPAEIKDVQAVLQLPAVKKGLDAFYAISKLVTGFNYDDARKLSDFSAWARGFELDARQGLPGVGGQVPSKRRMAKAQALMDDLISISHLDEMASDIRRFVRDVYAETAPMSEEEREDLREEADQFEFTYNFQKAIVLAAAPSVIAAALTDEQLAQLHGLVRSPVLVKAFDLLRNAVKASTAFTKEDILEAQKSFENLQKRAEQSGRSAADQDKAKAEWDALIDKWTGRLKNRIAPETRQGLEQALEDLENNGSPI
jgi:hypothetical protein